jgi:hypothetical protein
MIKHLTCTLLFIAASAVGVFAQDEAVDPNAEVVELPLVGSARLDLNTASGDQSQRQTFTVPDAGSAITVDVAVSEGGENRSGFDILLTYDDSQLAILTARPVDLFADAFLMTTQQTGKIGLTGLLLGDNSGSLNAGSIAHITFTVLDDFSGESRVSIESVLLGTALKIDSISVGTQSSIITLGGEITTVVLDKPDFDGDGNVGFTDFIIFASGFGSATGDQSFNPILDLDQSGDVGFADFLVFAQAFGT